MTAARRMHIESNRGDSIAAARAWLDPGKMCRYSWISASAVRETILELPVRMSTALVDATCPPEVGDVDSFGGALAPAVGSGFFTEFAAGDVVMESSTFSCAVSFCMAASTPYRTSSNRALQYAAEQSLMSCSYVGRSLWLHTPDMSS